MYNPDTYGWYQCDEENYNSNDSPEDQIAVNTNNEQDIARAWAELQSVPSYCERELRDRQCDACHGEYEESTGIYVDEDDEQCVQGVSLCGPCAGLA